MRLIFSITLVFFITALSACQNTVQGFGKDMQITGEKIQGSVDNHQN